jgi:hypothetical protein
LRCWRLADASARRYRQEINDFSVTVLHLR